jgi:hypothetical protein
VFDAFGGEQPAAVRGGEDTAPVGHPVGPERVEARLAQVLRRSVPRAGVAVRDDLPSAGRMRARNRYSVVAGA